MASGKKNYFRHSFQAGKDDKIVNLIADHGKSAYFHYFRLLELCGEQAAGSVPEKFVFHRRTLCAELMVTNSKLGHHLLAMQSSLLLQYFMDDRKVELLIPNLVKYLGKYSTKITSNTPNKKKEKEIKVNEIKRKERKETTDESVAKKAAARKAPPKKTFYEDQFEELCDFMTRESWERWENTYHDVAWLHHQIKSCLCWHSEKGSNRKSKQSWSLAITNWLSRCKDKPKPKYDISEKDLAILLASAKARTDAEKMKEQDEA